MPYNQAITIQKLKEYVKAKGESIDDRMDSGVCAALVALWLDAMAKDQDDNFLFRLEYVNSWSPAKLAKNGKKIDPLMEEFLHVVLALQDPNQVIPGIRQVDLHLSFPLILNSSQPMADAPELSLSFIFNKQSLKEIIPQIAQNNKMVRISNGLHVIGLMLRNEAYTLYDPESAHRPKNFTDVTVLAAEIFNDLSKFSKSKDYMAINFTIFDLTGNKKSIEFNTLDYIKKQLANLNIKREALQHKFLFFVLAKFNEYAAMDLLFDLGYTYIPWTFHHTPELNEAILFNDEKKVAYLINHGIPTDYAIFGHPTPLCEAITVKNNKLLYALLKDGANPNLKACTNNSHLNIALKENHPEAIVILLACGMNLGEQDLKLISSKYTAAQANDIALHAIQINKMFLQLPDTIDLSTANGKIITNLAQHLKLLRQLRHKTLSIEISYKGVTVTDDNLASTLIQLYKNEPLSSRFDAVDKDLLYQILSCTESNFVEYSKNNAKEEMQNLMAVLHSITEKFVMQSITQHTIHDILEMQVILEKINQLKFMLYDDTDLSKDEQQLRNYIENNKVKPITHKYSSIFSYPAIDNVAALDYEGVVLPLIKLDIS